MTGHPLETNEVSFGSILLASSSSSSSYAHYPRAEDTAVHTLKRDTPYRRCTQANIRFTRTRGNLTSLTENQGGWGSLFPAGAHVSPHQPLDPHPRGYPVPESNLEPNLTPLRLLLLHRSHPELPSNPPTPSSSSSVSSASSSPSPSSAAALGTATLHGSSERMFCHHTALPGRQQPLSSSTPLRPTQATHPPSPPPAADTLATTYTPRISALAIRTASTRVRGGPSISFRSRAYAYVCL